MCEKIVCFVHSALCVFVSDKLCSTCPVINNESLFYVNCLGVKGE